MRAFGEAARGADAPRRDSVRQIDRRGRVIARHRGRRPVPLLGWGGSFFGSWSASRRITGYWDVGNTMGHRRELRLGLLFLASA